MFSKLFKSVVFPNANKKQSQKLSILLGATGLSLVSHYLSKKEQAPQCCGIIGAISNKDNVHDVLLEGIQLLQNRGYDSAGLMTIQKDTKEFRVDKIASNETQKIDCIHDIINLPKILHQHAIAGIAHTRWATCGGKTSNNAHPHFDSQMRISVVHNGTLDNYTQLKQELTENYKIQLNSETDTELIAHIISIYMRERNLELKEAVQQVIQEQKIEGEWGLLIMDKNSPGKMVVARKGNPILIGLGEDTIYVASQTIAFQKYTSLFMKVEEGEVLELDIQQLQSLIQNKERVQEISEKIKIDITHQKQYSSFFEQEIYEQPESLLRVYGNGSRMAGCIDGCKLGGLNSHYNKISEIENMVVVACGSSQYASQFASSIFKKLKCFNSFQCIEGSEFCEYDLPNGKAGMILVSQSGETADLRKAQKLSKQNNMLSIGVINAVGSQLAMEVDCGIYLNCGREVAVAATKSFTSQIVALILIAVYISYKKDTEKTFRQYRESLITGLQLLPTTVGLVLQNIDAECKIIAQKIAKQPTIICLGKGPCSAIAKEGALKLKELTYIHAEAFSAGELKHGPLALINPEKPKSTAIILIILDDEYLNEMKLCLSEVHSRNALTIIITDCKQKLDLEKQDHTLEIKNAGVLTSLLTVLPFQKITNEICKILEINPDKPRNLAKTVTTN